MKEYAILAPVYFNDGRFIPEETQKSILRAALDLFGGYSVEHGIHGAWRDPATGEVYEDETRRILVASDKPADVDLFAGIVCNACDQVCVYVRYPDGSVKFIDKDANDTAASA